MSVATCCGSTGLFALLSIWCLLNLLRYLVPAESPAPGGMFDPRAFLHFGSKYSRRKASGQSRPGHKVFSEYIGDHNSYVTVCPSG